MALARIVDVDAGLERPVRRLDLVTEAAAALGDHDAVPGLLEAAARALRELDWPTATGPYVARQAGTVQQRNVWEPPADLDPRPPGLDEASRASVAAAGEALDRDLAALAERHPPAGAGPPALDLAPFQVRSRRLIPGAVLPGPRPAGTGQDSAAG